MKMELLVFILSLFSFVVGSDKLTLSHILYRHGARSPTRFFPKNPNQVDAWPDGTGRLSQKGIVMEYNLGKFLKNRYVSTNFINESYLHKEVFIRSSNIDRCLQSAEAQLAGLYPPTGYQIWNKEINWQPIPVQTVPGDEDDLLRPAEANCPRIGQIRTKMLKSDDVIKKTEENKELLDYMTKHSGENITLINIFDVTDDLLCEKAEGLKSADWAMKRFPEILNVSYWAFNYIFQGSDELGRLLGGSLLGLMVDNMKALKGGKADSVHKLNIFSGHDTSILAFTTALNVQFPIPEFSACILVEMYQRNDSKFYVTIDYRNGYGDNVTMTQMSLKGCNYKCPLEDFIRITSKRIPTDRPKECNPNQPFFTEKRLKIIAAVLMASTIFLFFLFIWMLVRYRYRNSYIQKRMNNNKASGKNKDTEKVINDIEDEDAALII